MADLKLAKDTDQEAIMHLLEDTLEMARSGKFKAMVILGVFKDDGYDTAWAGLGGMRMLEKIGMLELAKKDLLERVSDDDG